MKSVKQVTTGVRTALVWIPVLLFTSWETGASSLKSLTFFLLYKMDKKVVSLVH